MLVVDISVVAQMTFSLVSYSRPQRFPSCSLLIRCSMSLLCRCPADSCEVVGDSRAPTIAVIELWTRSLTCPCVQRQVPVAQFNKVVDVPVIMRGGSAPDSLHRRNWWTFQLAAVTSSWLSAWRFMAAVFCVILSGPLGRPGVERQFSEPSMAKSSSLL